MTSMDIYQAMRNGQVIQVYLNGQLIGQLQDMAGIGMFGAVRVNGGWYDIRDVVCTVVR